MLIAQGKTILNFEQEARIADVPGAGITFGEFIGGILRGGMAVGALLVLIFLIRGAINWITSGGDSGKVEAARGKITGALVGLIVLSATTAIFMMVQNFLGICILDFGNTC